MVLLRGRRSRTVSLISAGIAIAVAVGLFRQLPAEATISLWRPIELFGLGFSFAIDGGVWPILVLASAAVLAEALLDERNALRLLYSGIALAAIAGADLLALSMLWAVMILLETALRLRHSMELEVALRKASIQFIAVVAVLGASTFGAGAATLLALAVLIRSAGGADDRFPFSLAIMAPLGAMAAAIRFAPEGSALLWIAAGALTVALVQLVSRSKPALSKALLPAEPLFDGARQVGHVAARTLAATVRNVADVLEGESAVLWILLVLLLVIIGLRVAIT